MAIVLPFPSTKRARFIRRQAESMLRRPPGEAEKYLQFMIRRQIDYFTRKGVDPELIKSDVRGLEAAVRFAVWRSVIVPDGPKGAA
jgi:hypothetical protein